MYHLKFIIVTLLALSLSSFVNGGLTEAQKFNGVFNFVNQTIFAADGQPTYYYTNGPRGGIFYAPSFPGAPFGNMTALWGDIIPSGSSATPQEILAHTLGYGGPYILDAANSIVRHYPQYGTPLSILFLEQVRHYTFYENDNLLNLRVITPAGVVTGTLFWRRAVPLPVSRSCDLAINTTVQSTWISNNQRYTHYKVTIINTGVHSAISATIDVQANGVTIEQSSQVTQSSSIPSHYIAPLHGLEPGEEFSAAQFQVVGSGFPFFQLVNSEC